MCHTDTIMCGFTCDAGAARHGAWVEIWLDGRVLAFFVLQLMDREHHNLRESKQTVAAEENGPARKKRGRPKKTWFFFFIPELKTLCVNLILFKIRFPLSHNKEILMRIRIVKNEGSQSPNFPIYPFLMNFWSNRYAAPYRYFLRVCCCRINNFRVAALIILGSPH